MIRGYVQVDEQRRADGPVAAADRWSTRRCPYLYRDLYRASNAGNATTALHAIDRARDALAAPGLTPELPWFDYYDATRLHGFAGYATLRAERYDDARIELNTALGNLSRSAVKQRAVFLADLASVELHEGNLDHACKIAGDAAHQLHQAGYATGAGRLRDLRAALEPWNTTTPVRVLDDQLAALN